MASPKPLPAADYLRSLFSYDSETGEFHRKNGALVIGQEARGYIVCKISGSAYKVHRLIWKMVHDADPGEVDHKNGIKHDNRIDNLREVSHAQNTRNAARWRGKAFPKGVKLLKRTGRFQAVIRKDGQSIFLGSFKDPDSAHAAYRAAADKLHGEFARHD